MLLEKYRGTGAGILDNRRKKYLEMYMMARGDSPCMRGWLLNINNETSSGPGIARVCEGGYSSQTMKHPRAWTCKTTPEESSLWVD